MPEPISVSSYAKPRSDNEKFAILNSVVERALKRRPGGVLLGLLRGESVTAAGVTWDWVTAIQCHDPYKAQREFIEPQAFVAARFVRWINNLLKTGSTSDRFFARREVTDVIAKAGWRLKGRLADVLEGLDLELYDLTRDITRDELREATTRYAEDR